ncbi:hypothetical protein HPMG_00055 [Helicobacter pullorum MIT 98-5489]|uniref:Uncharacterized protein n=1 Tax=Helicobacter pullorum MIT 98-5489 TaxID=537972 RepID=C5EX54_9HELI|nr:hypothetical protein HPMG_00055 [Helicobacter pullorum MIT 98-5489]
MIALIVIVFVCFVSMLFIIKAIEIAFCDFYSSIQKFN